MDPAYEAFLQEIEKHKSTHRTFILADVAKSGLIALAVVGVALLQLAMLGLMSGH